MEECEQGRHAKLGRVGSEYADRTGLRVERVYRAGWKWLIADGLHPGGGVRSCRYPLFALAANNTKSETFKERLGLSLFGIAHFVPIALGSLVLRNPRRSMQSRFGSS